MQDLYPKVIPLLIRQPVITDAVCRSMTLQLASTGDVIEKGALSRSIEQLASLLDGQMRWLAKRAGCFDPIRVSSPETHDREMAIVLTVDALLVTRASPPTPEHTAVDGFFGIRDGSSRWHVELAATVSLRLFHGDACIASSSATWTESQLKFNPASATGATISTTTFSPLVRFVSVSALECAWGDLLRTHFDATQWARRRTSAEPLPPTRAPDRRHDSEATAMDALADERQLFN